MMGWVMATSFSPDGTQVLTASLDETVRIWSSDDQYLQGLIRAQNSRCLGAEFRQSTFGESIVEAEGHESACKTCVPKFLAQLKGVPAGDSKAYIAAWREYRECLDARS